MSFQIAIKYIKDNQQLIQLLKYKTIVIVKLYLDDSNHYQLLQSLKLIEISVNLDVSSLGQYEHQGNHTVPPPHQGVTLFDSF